MMTTEMTNEELTRITAERSGWEDLRWSESGRWVGLRPQTSREKREQRIVPKFATSMDACRAAGGPVEWLKKHPELKYMGMYHDGGAFRWECEVFLGIREVMRHADTLPRAFCLAFLAATEGED